MPVAISCRVRCSGSTIGCGCTSISRMRRRKTALVGTIRSNPQRPFCRSGRARAQDGADDSAKVSEAELRRIAQPHTRNLQVYEYFQRGQIALIVRQQIENETAREMFRRAIELDPSFARAYAGLALTYAADYRNQWTSDGAAALQRALELARTAHQINPDIRETYMGARFRSSGKAPAQAGARVTLKPRFGSILLSRMDTP